MITFATRNDYESFSLLLSEESFVSANDFERLIEFTETDEFTRKPKDDHPYINIIKSGNNIQQTIGYAIVHGIEALTDEPYGYTSSSAF